MSKPLEFKATCDLCDDLGDKARVAEADWKSYGAVKQFCGYAATVRCLEDNSGVKEYLTAYHGKGQVLVVDGGGSRRCALMGDVIAGAAVKNKWAGIIIYGSVRDVDALAQLDLGVQAIGNTPRKSTRAGRGQSDVVAQIGNVSVSPGDLVYADNDGVVFVSASDVTEG